MVKKYIIFIILPISVFAAGFLVRGSVMHTASPTVAETNARPPISENPEKEFPLINRAVVNQLDEHYIINFAPLKKKFIETQKKYPQKTFIYFLYLNNDSWIGLNERDLFVAASTIKVPLAMSLYKASEEGKLRMDDEYTLSELDLDDNFGELYKAGPDKSFSLEELTKIMLEQSDNTAAQAIVTALKRIGISQPLSDVYMAMGWDSYSNIGVPVSYQDINVKTLANMISTLYNATYVNVKDSQNILHHLINSPFNDKIVAGVPEGVLVAHKIGVSTPDATFSDCGIVYASNRNYLLCLGSNGGDEGRAAKFMAEISKAAYDYVINN